MNPVENYEFGGVDSRSNPFALPANRALRCLNWAPNPGGWLELRRGYQQVVTTGAIGSPIHSIADYQTLDNSGNPVRWLMIGAGLGVWTLQLSNGALTHITDLPTADKWGVFYANGQIHIGTKAGVWFWDGTTLRKSGIRAMAPTEYSAVTVHPGVHSPTSSEIASITVTPSATGGSMTGPTSNGGIQLYMFYFDVALQGFGASAAIPQSAGVPVVKQLTGTGLVNKLTVAGLPNLSSVNANLVKVFAATKDGGSIAGLCVKDAINVPLTLVGASLSFTIASGWVIAGSLVLIDFTSADPSLNGIYQVASVTNGGLTANVLLPRGPIAPLAGNFHVYIIPAAGNTATTFDVLYDGSV